MVKITDVAMRAGVAKSTVSNVLTGNKFVSEELRQKVLAACKELDFQPNFYASGLSRRKTNIIALLLEATSEIASYPFYKDLIVSCLQESSKKGYSLLVYYDSDQSKLLQTLRQGRAPIDGAILLAPSVNDERLVEMESNRTICVVIGSPADDRLSFVDIDNRKLVKTVAEQLINQYGKDIYLINSREDMTISRDRKAAFCEVCAQRGIDVANRIYVCQNDGSQQSYDFAKANVKPNAVFITANESRAKDVYRAAEDKGLTVGRDVAVFSLGRSVEHGVFSPKLSYAHQNYENLGKIAVQALIDEIETGKHSSALIDSEIIYRESTSKN